MQGLAAAHKWFDTRLQQKIAVEYPGTPIFFENQAFTLSDNQVQIMASLTNSATDTKSMDIATGHYKYKVQYQGIFLIPERGNVYELDEMVARFSVWFNEKHLTLAGGVTMVTDRTSAANIGNRDQHYAKEARVSASIFVRENCV